MRIAILALIAMSTMGIKGCGSNNYNITCQAVNYPLCQDVPYDYPCLCLSSPDGLDAVEAEDLRRIQ